MRGPEKLLNIKPTQIPNFAPWLEGIFFYSRTQRKLLDRQGRERFFMQTKEREPQIIEYTEMIGLDMVVDDPYIIPMYPDATFVGRGYPHHVE